MLIREDAQRELLVYAFRYALGRSRYSTLSVQEVLRAAWPELSMSDRMLYQREIREREAMGEGAMGMEIDKRRWLELLKMEVMP